MKLQASKCSESLEAALDIVWEVSEDALLSGAGRLLVGAFLWGMGDGARAKMQRPASDEAGDRCAL